MLEYRCNGGVSLGRGPISPHHQPVCPPPPLALEQALEQALQQALQRTVIAPVQLGLPVAAPPPLARCSWVHLSASSPSPAWPSMKASAFDHPRLSHPLASPHHGCSAGLPCSRCRCHHGRAVVRRHPAQTPLRLLPARRSAATTVGAAGWQPHANQSSAGSTRCRRPGTSSHCKAFGRTSIENQSSTKT